MADTPNNRPAKGRAPGKRKTPQQAVAASRLVRKAKRRGFGKGANDGVVFFGGVEKRTTRGGKDKFTLNLLAQARTIDVSADKVVDIASHGLLVWYRSCILNGSRPDGSPQVKLSQATMARGDRLTPYRGAASGTLADGLRRSAITGTTTRAKCVIQPPTTRNIFIAAELRRNIHYIGLAGGADEVIRETVQQWLSAAIADQVRDADKSEKTAVKADDT